mgnify:FL=1
MILTLTGASGAGKTTIAGELLKKLPIYARMVPSYTTSTRKPRPTDLPGEYKYVSKFRFWFLKKIGAFLWTVYPHGNSYGTTKRWVSRALKDDSTVYVMLLFSDAIKKLNGFAEEVGYSNQVFSFFILSPAQEILRERLKSRGDEEGEIEKRIADCIKWDSEAKISDISYEFVENNSTIESVTEKVITEFVQKFDDCDSYF